jgi:hypothetical protein
MTNEPKLKPTKKIEKPYCQSPRRAFRGETMKEILRISIAEIVEFRFPIYDLMFFCMGKNIINNKNVVRMDDVRNNDIVFYETEHFEGKEGK